MYLFFDTETTGTNTNTDHVVQLAWIRTDRYGYVVAKESYVVRPTGYSIPQAAANVHGVTTAYALEIGKPLTWVLNRFSQDAAQASVAVAHNLSFDFRMLQSNYRKAGLTFPLDQLTKVCTMKESTHWCQLPKPSGAKGFKTPKLTELHLQLFNESFDDAHDALVDTQACMRCYFELVRRGVIGKTELGEMPVAHPPRRQAVELVPEPEDQDSRVHKANDKKASDVRDSAAIKLWILDDKSQTIRSIKTGAIFSLSSLKYIESPIPGYESITHQLWIRQCDIEATANDAEVQPWTDHYLAEQETRRIAHIREVQNAHVSEPVTPPREWRLSETMQAPVPESSAEVKCLQRAAAQGDVLAKNRLGQIYAKGDGIPKDMATAVRWWKNAAAQGHIESQYNLGVAYVKGIGQEKDLVLALAWLNIAATGGKAVAVNNRDLVKSRLSKAERLEAQRLASGWKKGQSLVR